MLAVSWRLSWGCQLECLPMSSTCHLVFLQHGIIKDDMTWCHADNARLDLFVCGAKPEADAVAAGFGHPPGVVRYLGLCRYDGLPTGGEREKSGMVLFMPTWRAR